MSETPDLRLILHYRKTATYGLNVLLGSLEAGDFAVPPGLEIRAVRGIDRLVAELGESTPAGRTVVCWSFYSPEALTVKDELARALAVTPSGGLHVAGGVHAAAEPAETLRMGFDLVGYSEGESTIRGLVEWLHGGADAAGAVPGLAWLDENGQMVKSEPPERRELDAFPAFAPRSRRFNPIEITRGCIYACGFCQTPFMFKSRFRHRSVPNVRRHVAQMAAEGFRDVRFITPTSLSYGSPDESVNLDAIEGLLSGVADELGGNGRIFFGSFPSEVRPEHVTPEALRVIKRYAANTNLIIGAQSGSDDVLAATNRGHGTQPVLDAVRYCVEAGIVPNVDFIFGLPSETPADRQKSLRFAQELTELGARIHGHTFMPLPGTPLRTAPAGRVDAETRQQLEAMTSDGIAYGKWRQQEKTAEQLVQLTSHRRKRQR